MVALSRRAFLTGVSAVAISATVKPLAAVPYGDVLTIEHLRRAKAIALRAGRIPEYRPGYYALPIHPAWARLIEAKRKKPAPTHAGQGGC